VGEDRRLLDVVDIARDLGLSPGMAGQSESGVGSSLPAPAPLEQAQQVCYVSSPSAVQDSRQPADLSDASSVPSPGSRQARWYAISAGKTRPSRYEPCDVPAARSWLFRRTSTPKAKVTQDDS
jgi:hypothetical protein